MNYKPLLLNLDNLKVAEMWLANNADVNSKDNNGSTILYKAAFKGNFIKITLPIQSFVNELNQFWLLF